MFDVDDDDIEMALEYSDGDFEMAAEVLAGHSGISLEDAEDAIEEYCNANQ